MIAIAIVAGIIASALNAGSGILQRLAAGKPKPQEIFSREFTARVSANRKFIVGFGLQILAFLMQAVALKYGPIALVEPVMTLDLVFLLLFLRFRFDVAIGIAEWLAVGAVCGGLGLLFLMGRPESGSYDYQLSSWIAAISIVAFIVITAAIIVRRLHSPSKRAALAGLAASGTYALNSISVKLAIHGLNHHGFGYLLVSWPLYTLIISGIASIFLMQNMYGAGPLAVSQPVIEIGEPVIAVAIGVTVFGETLHTTPLDLALESIGAIAIAWGIIRLSRSENIHSASDKGI